MSGKRITAWDAQIEILTARCALESVVARHGNSGATKAPNLFIQPFEADIADIERALTTSMTYVAQQNPQGEVALVNRTATETGSKNT
ncbi:hypothetical protein LY56_03517 [Roseinatronobacter thiooxidans]|uniref:Uncharacterized protein n=1 Tax=Roseinatronobacter thiooxidans TaxID=121821 RepID=A0A2W7PJ21_9RHOB|nr:hypothetical protein [Roseinatronobacter thiooxidans]PZX36231.1 hypothetical protein LY56_03517 [Roseinatronobacter thiooxidans]